MRRLAGRERGVGQWEGREGQREGR
jgi:hypothetical protein